MVPGLIVAAMEYSEQYLREYIKYLDAYSILVIYGRRLIKVRCPLRVRVLVDIAGWKEGDEKWVEKVMVTRDLRMVYIIQGAGYHFYLFQILLH